MGGRLLWRTVFHSFSGDRNIGKPYMTSALVFIMDDEETARKAVLAGITHRNVFTKITR